MDFWKGRQKQKKQNRKKINTLGQAFGGNKIDKKTSKIAVLGLFTKHKTKTQATKNRTTKNQKKTYQKRPFCILANNPYFW